MKEGYRPEGGELWSASKEGDQQGGGVDLREKHPVPEDVQEALKMYRNTIEQEMVHDFGIPEIPKSIEAEMQFLAKSIEQKGKEELFKEELDESIYEQLQQLALRVALYQQHPTHIQVTALPEEGYRVSYQDQSGKQRERAMSEDEQDLLFQLEMWGDQLTVFQNSEQFKTTLAELQKKAQNKPMSERDGFVQTMMEKKYRRFGFTSEQLRNLVLLAEEETDLDLRPEGDQGGIEKIKIMQEVWKQYLSGEEKTQYVKLAAGMTVAGAVEGIAPLFLGKSMDSTEAKMAALFALGFLGIQVGAGWVKRHLQVDFNTLLNDITEKQEGLNARLARDLVFQPGEQMSHGENRGKIIASLRRSQSAFRTILSSVAQTAAPAIASTTMGLGLMLANDWRLGMISLASAPIAIAISHRANRRLEPLIRDTYETEAKVAQEVEEQIIAHQDIVLGGMREQMAGRLQELGTAQNKLGHQRHVARLDLQYQTGSVLGSGVVAGLTIGGVALRQFGLQDPGAIVSAIVYSNLFRNNLDAVLYTNHSLLDSLRAVTEMEEIFNGYAQEETEADKQRIGASEIPEFSINVKGVSLEIDGNKIIDSVDFQVPAGAVMRLEGQSGQGKTTMTRLMSGYYQPTEGEILIGGHPVNSIKKTGPDRLYRHVAYLSQHPYVFETGNVQENIAFGNPDVSTEAIETVLQELGLDKRFRKNGKIDLQSSVQGLSGGERARLGLGRVLLKIRSQENGSIVFLDQPTEELDATTEAEVARILLEEKRRHPKTTFVIISHRQEFIDALTQPKEGEGLTMQSVTFEQGKLVTTN